MPVGVAYDTDLREAKKVLTELLKEDPATLKKKRCLSTWTNWVTLQ